MRFIHFGCLLLVLTPSVYAEDPVTALLKTLMGTVSTTIGGVCKIVKKLPFAKGMDCNSASSIQDSLGKLMAKSTDGSCQLANSTEVPIIVTIDLQFDKKCQGVNVGCGAAAGAIPMVVSLLQCVLSNLGGLLGKSVPTLLSGGVLGKLPEALGVVLLILWAVLGKVMALMCVLNTASVTLLLSTTVPSLLLGVLASANLGSVQIPGLGPLLSPILMLVTLIVGLVLPLVSLLGPILGGLVGGLVVPAVGPLVNGLLGALTGLPATCSTLPKGLDCFKPTP